MLVSDCLVRHSEQSRNSSHEAPPPTPPQAWFELSRPKKFLHLAEDFRKRKNKSHGRDITRTASSEGNFENNEEFILVYGRVTVDELLRNLATTAVLYVQIFTPTCNSGTNEKQ
jgi:hypothetical protein